MSLHIAIIFFPLSLTPGAMILTRRHCHQLRYGRYFKSEHWGPPLSHIVSSSSARSTGPRSTFHWFCSNVNYVGLTDVWWWCWRDIRSAEPNTWYRIKSEPELIIIWVINVKHNWVQRTLHENSSTTSSWISHWFHILNLFHHWEEIRCLFLILASDRSTISLSKTSSHM